MSEKSETAKYPQAWMTIENPPRMLTAKGQNAMDPDCAVAYLDGDDSAKPLWILHNGKDGTDQVAATVIGLKPEFVKAIRLPEPAIVSEPSQS